MNESVDVASKRTSEARSSGRQRRRNDRQKESATSENQTLYKEVGAAQTSQSTPTLT